MRPLRRIKVLLLLSGLPLVPFAIIACSQSNADTSAGGGSATGGGQATQVTAADRTEAAQIFRDRCGPCHGEQGTGDGPASKTLTPRPRNLRDAAWQRTVDDAYLERIVQYGGAAVGKAATMPPNPDLQARPAIVAALREHIRQLGR